MAYVLGMPTKSTASSVGSREFEQIGASALNDRVPELESDEAQQTEATARNGCGPEFESDEARQTEATASNVCGPELERDEALQTKATASSYVVPEIQKEDARRMATMIADALKEVLSNGVIQDVVNQIRTDLVSGLQQAPAAHCVPSADDDERDVFGQLLTDALQHEKGKRPSTRSSGSLQSAVESPRDLTPGILSPVLSPKRSHEAALHGTFDSIPSIVPDFSEPDPQERRATELKMLECRVASQVLANESIGAQQFPQDARVSPEVYGCVPHPFSSSESSEQSRTNMRRVDKVRAKRMKELTRRLSDISGDDARSYVLKNALYPVLRCFGILPWDLGESDRIYFRPALWYQWAVLLLSFWAVVTSVQHVAHALSGFDGDDAPLQAYSRAAHPGNCLLSDGVLAVGSFLGLLLLRTWSGSRELCSCNVAMLAYMFRESFLQEWKKRQCRESLLSLAIWCCAVFCRVHNHISTGAPNDADGLLYLIATLFSTTILAGLVYCSLYFCNALTGLIDLFGVSVVGKSIDVSAAHEWNVLLAVLRTASSSIEWCILTLQAAAGLTTLLALIDVAQNGTDILLVLPEFLFVVNAARVLFRAASVTDKCVRLPMLINSLSCAQVDPNRQYVIEFINNSAAGFYVFECRLSTVVALKSMYVFCGVVFAFATRAV